MSSKFKFIITLFVLIEVLSDISVVSQLNEGFNDCFRLCLTRFTTNTTLRSHCITDCKHKFSLNDHDKHESNGKNRPQDLSIHKHHMNDHDDTMSTKAQVKETKEPDESKESTETESTDTESTETTTSIKYYGSIDYIGNVESPIVMDNDNNVQEGPTFKSIIQPDHCGFKSTKDMKKRKLLGGVGMGRVVGGVDAEEHEFPWIVSIQYYRDVKQQETVHFCGGAIITKNYIITAAHCMDRFVGKERALVFKIGVNSPKQDSVQIINATKVIVHEKWDSSRQLNDIALIKVKPDIQFTTIEGGKYAVNALCLPTSSSEAEGDAVLAGWGEEAFKTGVAADYLQKVTVPFVDRSQCHDIYKKYLARVSPGSKVKVGNSHICAGGKGGEDACRGDSGGPLLQSKARQSFHLGIVSFSVPCAVKDLPTIYTNVVYFMDWIHKHVMKSH